MTDDVLTLEELRRRRPEILRVARKRRAHRVAVFGSVARGEARQDSDLGDVATKLPDEVIKATPEIPWRVSWRICLGASPVRAPGEMPAAPECL